MVDNANIWLLTAPTWRVKSLLRPETRSIALMAQMGSYVPAASRISALNQPDFYQAA